LETSGRHLTPLAQLLAFKESYLTIFVDLLFGISFELVSKRRRYEAIGHRTRSVFDRYNIVSSDDLVEANEKLEAFLTEAVKESKIEKLQSSLFCPGSAQNESATTESSEQCLHFPVFRGCALRVYW
jgi:hypothetical protein